jgi:hypothetical protein
VLELIIEPPSRLQIAGRGFVAAGGMKHVDRGPIRVADLG